MTPAEALRAVCDAWEQGERVLAVGHFASRLRDGGDRFDFPFAILVELSDAGIERLAEYFDTKPLVP